MNALFFSLALVAQGIMVTGQILLKQALGAKRGHRVAATFAMAIACMAVYFFVWMALAGVVPLSQLAPFDALAPLLLVMAAHVVLHERLSARAWMGVILILAGVGAIAVS